MSRIDLNCDLGEGGAFDLDFLALVSSANIGCGAHAGSAENSVTIAREARKLGVRIGAHPSIPDRPNFGRKLPSLTTDEAKGELLSSLLSQCDVLKGRFTYVKPHGALYNDSAQGGDTSGVLTSLLAHLQVPLMGLAGSEHARIARVAGVDFIREGFADRRYDDNGLLIPRSQNNALLTDRAEIVAQIERLSGEVDSICIHSDHDGALDLTKFVRSILNKGD